jgi:hypothetical protein
LLRSQRFSKHVFVTTNNFHGYELAYIRGSKRYFRQHLSDRRRSKQFNVWAVIRRSAFVTVEEKTLVVL